MFDSVASSLIRISHRTGSKTLKGLISNILYCKFIFSYDLFQRLYIVNSKKGDGAPRIFVICIIKIIYVGGKSGENEGIPSFA